MKKLFAVVLALVLALSTVSALATEVTWEEASVAAEGVDGDFYLIEQVGLAVWVPAVLQPVELPAEAAEDGYIACFMTAEQGAGFTVQYLDGQGNSLEAFAATMETAGAVDIENVVINGLPAISFEMPESDASVIACATEAGYYLVFSFSPMSDEGFRATAVVIGASIQAAE